MSGEQHWIDGVEFGGRVNKKEGGGSIRIVLGLAAVEKKGTGGGLCKKMNIGGWGVGYIHRCY